MNAYGTAVPCQTRSEANLGCATTEELLREIAARLEDDPGPRLRQVAYWCRSAADWAARDAMEYRTVDQS